ncbi:endonuclease [Salinimicrobium sp. TIG7-5_MAKvit]|uniref:endonuclease n=1 Tax=Salinimicrobium sp. TIG7-5_MAKvit TaxID=3121289 RepID=UPI003C6E0E92
MKKRFLSLFILVVLFSCSTDDSGSQPNPNPEPKEKPVANDDFRTAVENETIILNNITQNDVVVDNARIKSFDSQTSQGGKVKDNRDGTYTYTPPVDFIGEDSFSYLLCVPGDSERCSTAEVLIDVVDGGSPETTDDTVNTMESMSIILENLLSNDVIVDGSSLSSVNSESSTGNVKLSDNGTVTYTPADGFTGEDSFTYTICDNDQPEPTCDTGIVTVNVYAAISFNIPATVQEYYKDFAFTSNGEINYEFISDFTSEKHTTILSYGQRHDYLYEADEDLNNPDNVILMYSGESRYWEEYWSDSNDYEPQTFNTEHIYPQSRLNSELAVADMHHLRVADADINSLRLNYPYVDGAGEFGLVTEETFYPGDKWKGDVARMIMYLNVRYGENFEQVGGIELFLKWNVEDPVSDFEIQRNNIIEGAQGNRNPFIDNPFLATLIWGGEPAENLWH